MAGLTPLQFAYDSRGQLSLRAQDSRLSAEPAGAYRELGGDYFDRLRPETTAKRLIRRLKNLDYQVTLQAPQEALTSV